MIKINLLPQKRPRRQAEPGQQQVLVGVLALALAFVGVYFGYHRGRAKDLADLKETNGGLTADNGAKKAQVAKNKEAQALIDAEKERSAAIEKLVKAKSVPAFLLQELGDILTPGRQPTMTKLMAQRVSEGNPYSDPNRFFATDWDPKHVWITSLVEKNGAFTLQGGAQSDADVTQLAKRMQASVYFQDVTPRGGERTTDPNGSVTYYAFTITGKVVY